MRKVHFDQNRRRRLEDFKPLEATREQRAMAFHEHVQKYWQMQGERLAKLTGRDPSTLSMFSEDEFVRKNEERYLISQVAFALASKDMGTWSPLPRIGDLYAQRELPPKRLKNFELIRNPDQHESAHVEGQRPTSFFQSKYYKKRVKQLQSHIDRLKPHDPDYEGLVVTGEPWPNSRSDFATEDIDTESIRSEVTIEQGKPESSVKVALSANRLFFTTKPGASKARSIIATNEGTTAVYYKWELAKDVELMLGSGSGRTPVRKSTGNSDTFDWRESEQFSLPTNMAPKVRTAFCFTQLEGSILPGASKSFDFTFKSDVQGCFNERWIMKTTPQAQSNGPLTVSLRGCCEVEPPNLTSFKQSIDNSLHESERTRCVEEILSAVFDRVSRMCALHSKQPDERIEGDVLVDDRAPAFEEANKEWSLQYSPGLFTSLQQIAEQCWDALGITGFDRFWDLRIVSLSSMAMKIADGNVKRAILTRLNQTIKEHMTESAGGNLTFSLAYIQMVTLFDDIQEKFKRDAAALGCNLPLFLVPKVPDPSELEEALESQRRRGRGRGQRRTPQRRQSRRGRGAAEEEAARLAALANENKSEYSPELKAAMKQTILAELRLRISTFENLAGESKGVAQQLTRVNEIDRLDTNLDAEVDDEI